MNRIPVTILSGFLGSGKTTLLNHLIKKHPEKKFAIIENEFGEISIDSELVVGAKDGIFELANGCICCTMNGELINVLDKLLASYNDVDHLLIETTGIADPTTVAMGFLTDYKIQSVFRLDGIVALADALFIQQQLVSREEVSKQIAVADVIVINKTDLVSEDIRLQLSEVVRLYNPFARIVESNHGKTEGTDLLNISGFNKESVLKLRFEGIADEKSDNKFSKIKLAGASAPNSSLIDPHKQTPSSHASIRSYSFIFPEDLDVLKFDLLMRNLLNRKSPEIYRVKGILNFYAIEEKQIFQAVNSHFSSEYAGKWGDEERISKIVFIGNNLNKELLEAGLKICHFDKPFTPSEFYPQLQDLISRLDRLEK